MLTVVYTADDTPLVSGFIGHQHARPYALARKHRTLIGTEVWSLVERYASRQAANEGLMVIAGVRSTEGVRHAA
jgi:hypothetical protein